MLWILKDRSLSIGVDMGDDTLKLAQLASNGKAVKLVYGSSKHRPANIKSGSADWQLWAIETVKEMIANGHFRGKDVIAAMPASEVFVDHVRIPKTQNTKPEEAVLAKIKPKLPFSPEEAMIKFIPTEEDNCLIIATEREKINRHLAIYEKANLKIRSIGVWPVALTSTYVRFFGRRKTDVQVVVMLVDFDPSCTNVVICRHKTLLFVRSIPLGRKQLGDEAQNEQVITRLVLELNACRRQFASLYSKANIERLIFLSGQSVEKSIYTTIAKQLELPAQMGDCLAAVQIDDPLDVGIDRRSCEFSWATAFGLSLS